MKTALKEQSRTINAWCMYDWSELGLFIDYIPAVFPSYFFGVTGGKDHMVNFLGFTVKNTVLYSYTLSFSFLLVALLNPLLSSIADTKATNFRL